MDDERSELRRHKRKPICVIYRVRPDDRALNVCNEGKGLIQRRSHGLTPNISGVAEARVIHETSNSERQSRSR